MGIRTGANAPLGCPLFGVAYDLPVVGVPLGRIEQGFDDVNNRTDEYILLQGVAGIAAGDEVEWNAAYLCTEVGAGLGGAIAIAPVVANQYGWFRIIKRPQGPVA